MLLFLFLDRILFESSVTESSSWPSLIDCSLGSSVLFFQYVAIFYLNVLLLFFIKNRCSVLHNISKKNFTLKNRLWKKWRNTSMMQARFILKVYHQWFINYLYCWIYSTYILHKKFNKILQEGDWSFVLFWNLKSLYFICSHSLSFLVPLPVICCHSLSLVITRCHSLSLAVFLCHSWHLIYRSLSLVVIFCHSLLFVVTSCTTRCHSLYRCHLLYHSLSFFVTCCHPLPLDIPLVCLYINDPFDRWYSFEQ